MAIATFAMAWKTRALARETKSVAAVTLDEARAVEWQVELTERQVTVSGQVLQASVQPWLTWEPAIDVGHDDGLAQQG